ncbi:MAG: ABC transporter ATP-binding protein [Promethearchaeota archaeon]|jgi:ABC-type multidrug transport system ATPase subunit
MVKSNTALLNCENISKQYGYFFALKKISFQVNKNTIFGIAGANGAGKTTLIKILSGLLKPTFGKIVLNGLNYDDNSTAIRQNIGITTDESYLFEELTIFENLKYYANLHLNFDKEKIKKNISQYCEKFNLTDWIDEPVRILSHGMKQKVELVRVLIHEPLILFLDEPFSGLDYNATTMLINFFKELQNSKNISIILTTHKIEVYQQLCNDLIILKQGKINKAITREEFNETKIKSYF